MNNIYYYYSNENNKSLFKDDANILLEHDLPSDFQLPHSINTVWFCINVKFLEENNFITVLQTLKGIAFKYIAEGKETGIFLYKDGTKCALHVKHLEILHLDKYNIKHLEIDGHSSQGFPSLFVKDTNLASLSISNVYSATKNGINISKSNISLGYTIHNLKIEKFVINLCKIESLEVSWLVSDEWFCLHYSNINKVSLSQVETKCLLLNNTIMTSACIVNITLFRKDSAPIMNFLCSVSSSWVIQNIFIKHEATDEQEETCYDMINVPVQYLEDIEDLTIDTLPKCYLDTNDNCIIKNQAELLSSLRKTFSIMKGSAEMNFDFIASYSLASLEKGLKERELNIPEEKKHNLGSRLLFFLSKITSNHNQSLVRVCIMYFVNIVLGTAVIYSQSTMLTIIIGCCFALLGVWFFIKSQQEAMIFLGVILFLRIANTLPYFQKGGDMIGIETIIVNILLPFPSFDVKIMAYGSVVAITIFLFKIFSTYLLWQTLQTSKAQFR